MATAVFIWKFLFEWLVKISFILVDTFKNLSTACKRVMKLSPLAYMYLVGPFIYLFRKCILYIRKSILLYINLNLVSINFKNTF